MSYLRPEIVAGVRRHREVFAGAAIGLLGVWIATFGGWFFAALGLLVALAGLAVAVLAWRRLRFGGDGGAPGVVQVVEGQIGYFGPQAGGFVSLAELEEIRLAHDPVGGRAWVLVDSREEPLTVPARASGADALYDAFASLPGIDMSAVLAALEPGAGTPSAPGGGGVPSLQVVRARGAAGGRVLWRRATRPALT